MLRGLPALALCRVLALLVALGLGGLPQAVRADPAGDGHRCRCPKVAHECRCRHCRSAEQLRAAAAQAKAEADADAKLPPCHLAAKKASRHLPPPPGDRPYCVGFGCDGAPEDAPRLAPTEVFLPPDAVTLLRRPLDERLASAHARAVVRGDRPPAPPPRASSPA